MREVKAKGALLLLGGIIVLGVLALAWAIGPSSSEAQQDAMHNCPQAGKWAISVWSGPDDTETGEALATCGAVPVVAAYYLDPQTQGWSYWFAGQAGMSTLTTLDNQQGVLALGAMGATPSTPTATPTPGAAGDVVLLSSNAFTTTSSTSIDGEYRRFNVVGELRNESATPRSAGEIRINIYDAAGNVIGRKWTYAFGESPILLPGQTTAFRETYPSFFYFSDETNYFPEGWTRYEIDFSPRDPYSLAGPPINVTVHNVQASIGAEGQLRITGTVRNDDSRPQKWSGEVYAILYDQQDKILNAASNSWYDELQPGRSTDFEIEFPDNDGEPIDYSRYLVQASAEGE